MLRYTVDVFRQKTQCHQVISPRVTGFEFLSVSGKAQSGCKVMEKGGKQHITTSLTGRTI